MAVDASEQIEKFKEFLHRDYEKLIYENVRKGNYVLAIDFSNIMEFDHELADQLIEEPEETLKAVELAIESFDIDKSIRARVFNLPQSQFIMIRDIRSTHLDKLMYIEGIVRQSSDVRPQVTSARFECPSCGNNISILQLDTKFKEPSRCSCGRKGKFRLISKDLVDAQRLVIEETPEALEGGEQPKRLSVFLKEDLVEPRMEKKTTPGSKVRITGIVKEVPITLKTGAQSIRYDLMMESNYIMPIEETFSDIDINEEDENQIKELAKDPSIYEKLTNAIAPSIYGHERVKEAIILQLMGGVRKKKEDGTVTRGDMHILLVGDPGCISGDSQVSLINKGMEPIQNLGKKHLEKIKEAVTKIRENSKDKYYDFATVFHHYKEQPVLKITTETGKEIICTYNQPLLTREGWKRADEILLYTEIRVMPKIPNTIKKLIPTKFTRLKSKSGHLKGVKLPDKFTPELASLCGYIIGDGRIHKDGYSMTLYVNNEETDLIEKISELWKNTFDIEPTILTRNINEEIKSIKDDNGSLRLFVSSQQIHNIWINSKQVASSLSFLSNKRVPQQIFKSPLEVISKFIGWLFEADGCAFGKGRGRTSIQLKSSTIGLLHDVQLLLLYFGIHSRIIQDNLCIRRSFDMELFAKYIGFNSEKKKAALNEVLLSVQNKNNTQKRKKFQRWEKITQIIPHGSRDVYDFEVPVSKRFIANGIVCHNSGKSQILTFVSKSAPKARFVSGKGVSGAGLTASVVKDEFLRGWALEAGALVLANGGYCCIDELDKMTPEDRSAMHEAMEQQQVSISKANIQACYSSDTEILTDEGWKKYWEVKKERLAQFNIKDKTIKFLPHKGLYVYNYKGKMYHFKNKRDDILVTPNHRMLTKESRQKDYNIIEAEKINYSRISFLNSGNFINTEKKHFILPPIKHKQNRKHIKYTHQHSPKKIPMDLWLEFLGYYLTEGGIQKKPSIGIPQKSKENVIKIKKCLSRLSKYVGFTLSETKDKIYTRFQITNTQLFEFLENNCGKKCTEKRFPLSLSSISKRQMKIIFGSMMLGDGSSDGKSFSSSSKELIDTFQIISCLIGKSASQHVQYEPKTRGNRVRLYRVCLSEKIEHTIRKNKIKKIDYKNKVFCFSTDTGFFITRRNGKIAIQGNTLRAQTTILAAANPKLGRFDPYTPIAAQIDLPSALINRFDLIFPIRDIPNKELDEKIASHVLKLQQTPKGIETEIPVKLLRKYIAYARQKINPVLTDSAIDEIKDFYVALRNTGQSGEEQIKPIPISARQLEALVRLAEGSARLRLSKKVSRQDARRSINLLKHCLMQVGIDPETGKIDIDRISTGISASQRSRIIVIREIIKNLEGKIGKSIPVQDIIVEAAAKGIDESQVEEALEKLTREGNIFQPKRDTVSVID